MRVMLATAFSIVVATGCGSHTQPPSATNGAADAASVDPDDVAITEADVDMPANYAAAIPRIAAYRDTIRAAVEAGTPAKAHRALDESDIVLGKLMLIARDSGVPREQWETVNVTARELRDLFHDVHAAIDAKRTPDYASVATPIDEAIKRLAAVESPARN
ncbi:MAG: hypothetical protein HYX69_00850 [Planctomycetia bacterium]|nr:hypothetical protein [Planctomycetia bacterium]